MLACAWQRCTVHFVRNMHGHCRRSERGLISAALRLRSTNPLERLNKEIGRRSDIVGIFPDDASASRLIGPMLIEHDEWLVCRRYLSEELLAVVLEDQGDQDREEAKELKAAPEPRRGVAPLQTT